MSDEIVWGPTEESAPPLGPPPPPGRLFCDACRKPHATDSGLCPDCGDRLVPMGYCPVCEAFLLDRVEVPCPKHEVPLATGPPSPMPVVGNGERIDWVTVASYHQPFEAEAARLRLDAEGISAILDGLRMATNTAYHVATGGVRLQVPKAQEQEARVLLSQSWSVPGDDEDEDVEVDWDEVAPVRAEPGDWRGALLFWGVVLSLVVVIAGLIGLASD